MKNKIIFTLILTTLFLTSCDEEFLERTPTDQVSASDATASVTNAEAVLNGIHRDLYQRQEGIQGNAGIGGSYIHMDLLGEDQVVHREQWHNRVYKWQAPARDSDFYSRFHWVAYYKWIGNANVIINGIADATGDEDAKNAVLGQALIYRAFCHYQLVQIYGGRYLPGGNNSQLGVPYKKTADVENLARNTVEEVYTEI